MKLILQCLAIVIATVVNGYRIHKTDPRYGINIEVLDDPLFYNTFVPIIYEFKLPEWKGSDLKVKWPSGNSNQCYKSDAWNWSWDRQACPVVYHYNNLIDSVLRNMSDLWKGKTFTAKSNLTLNWPLDEIVPHFTGNKLNERDFNDYIGYFGKSAFAKPIVTKNISNNKDVNVQVYERMLSNFRGKSMISIAKEGSLSISSPFLYTQYAVLTNSYTAIQAMQILNFYMIRNEWAEAFSVCKNYKIPQYLVTQDMLLKSLAVMRKQLSAYHKTKYHLSINSDDLFSYYNLELTDCTFTTSNSFIVRILVPIRKADSKELLIKVSPIPFIRNEGGRMELCQVANVEGQYISRNEKMNMVHVDNCYTNGVCKVPSRSEWSVSNSCFSAIVNNDETEIAEFCFMDCQLYRESNGQYFKQIAANKYAIAGSSSEDGQDALILLSCSRYPHVRIKGQDYGAVIVTLPCDCALIYELDTLKISGECNEMVTFENSVDIHVIPYLWEKEVEITTESTDYVEVFDEGTLPLTPEIETPTEESFADKEVTEDRFVEKFEPFDRCKDTNKYFHVILILIVVISILFIVVFILGVMLIRLNRRLSLIESQIAGTSEYGTVVSAANSLQTINETLSAQNDPQGFIQQLYSSLREVWAILTDP